MVGCRFVWLRFEFVVLGWFTMFYLDVDGLLSL